MAVGTGFGFDVNALQKALDALDKNLAKVIKKGEDANKAFAAMFKGSAGIAFNKQLIDIKKNLELISKEKDPLKWDSKTLGNYVDQVNRMANTVEKMNQLAGTKGYKKIVPIDISELQNIQKELLTTYRQVEKLEKAAEQKKTARNQTYSGALRYSGKANTLEKERQAIENLKVARERLKQTDADYATKLNNLNEAIQRHEKNIKDATKTDRQRADEAAKNAQKIADAQAKYDSAARRERYKAYTTSYDGAIRTSDKAKTIAQEIRAVKNLEAARAKLNTTAADYKTKLSEINKRILQHNRNISQATEGARELERAHSTLGSKIATVFSVQAIRGYINKMIQVRGEMELQQRSLQAILQNTDAANEIWQKTIDLAVRSPFRISQLVTYTKQLAAYRVEADKLYETNKMLADVSAGLGVDMNRLILAFGQVKAANFLRGTELRQFTEAGIPMLDELANHFNDMNNTALTSADIFEMISKRMVLFEDVEAVFERMTRAGGTFYRMQEIQSETLRGQISNLKDSLDIMLNNIGRANEGTLKSSVKAVKLLVDNYEAFIPILKAIIAALAIYKVNAFASSKATLRLARSMGLAKISGTGLGGMLTSLRVNWNLFYKSLGKTVTMLSNNPWLVWISAILALGNAIRKVVKQFGAVDKAYNDMLNQQSEITSKFFKTNNIDEQKKAIKELVNYANKEYKLGIEVNLTELPDDEVKKYMNDLRQRMIEANAFGAEFQKELIEANLKTKWNIADWGKVGIFEQGLNKDIDQMGDSYDSLNRIMVNKLSRTIDELSAKWGDLSENEKEALASLKLGIGEVAGNENEDIAEYFDRLRENYQKLLDSGEVSDLKLSYQLRRYQVRLTEAEKEFETFIKGIDETVMGLDQEDKTVFLSAAIDDAKAEKNWSEFEETQIRKWLEKKYEIELTPKITEEDKELKAWQESYNELFTGKTGFRKVNSKGTSQKQIIEQLNAQYESTAEILKRIQQAGEDSVLEGGAYEGEDLEKLKRDLADIQEQLDWFGAEAKSDDKENSAVKILQKRINLLKEVNKKYLELEKTFDAVTAKEKVMDAYSDTFREAFAGTGVELDMYKVMTQVITDSKKVGEEMGSNLSEGVINKLKELEEAGTYIRNYTKEFIEFTKAKETFVPYAYYDWDEWVDGKPQKASESKTKKGTLTVGYGLTNKSGIGFKVTEQTTLDQAKAEELLIKVYDEKAKVLNKLLDEHRELIITQEQYNVLLDAAYQGPAAKQAIEYAAGEWAAFEKYLKGVEKLPDLNREKLIIDVDKIKEEWEALDSYQEKMALVLKWSNLTTKINEGTKEEPKWVRYKSSAMKKRSDERAAMFSGDLDIANQLETVLVRIAGMDFTTTEGMVEALGKLKEIAEKEGKEAKNVLSQTISGLEAEIGVRLKKESDKKLNDEVEGLFDQYELTLDLKKLNVPKELAEGLFGAKYLDLEGLRKAVTDRASKFIGTEQQEEYDKFLEKIDDMDRKALVERTQTYLEYAKLAVGERAKIKLEELRKLKEIEETFAEKEGDSEETKAYKRDIRERSSSRVKQDAKAALRKLEWDEFQKTDTFTSLFADIDDASDALVDHMIEKIRSFKEEWKDMPLEDVRTMVNKLNELEGALAERSPWEAYRKAKEEVKKARENAKFSFESEEARDLYGNGMSDKNYIAAVQIENEFQEEKAANAEREAAAIESILAIKTKEREGSVVSLGLSREQMEYTKLTEQELRDLLKTKKGEATTARAVVLANGQVLVQYKNQEKSLLKQKETLGEVQNMANDLYEAFTELAEALGADSESPAAIFADMGMNMMNAVLNTMMLQAQLKAVEVGAYAAGTALNAAMGVIGWIVMGVQLLTAGIKAIAKINDNKIVAQLEEQAEIIEKQRDLYEQIEKKVDKAYSVEQLRKYNKELDRSVELEIQALEASISMEKSRKNADEGQIAEWQKEISEARARLAESKQEMVEELGGMFDITDFTSGFVDAWWDAMDEGMSGLDALNEHFEETMKDLVKKQALYQGANAIMKQVQDVINKDLADDYDIDDWQKIWDVAKKANIDLDEFLKGWYDMFGAMSEGTGGSLSALQKGIQGITEDTAQVIEAYLNSIRGYVSEQVTHTRNIYRILNDAVHSDAAAIRVRMV